MAERDRPGVRATVPSAATGRVTEALHQSLRHIPARPIAVAFSGGLDSTVLLHACCEVLGSHAVLALHVHHGLQAAADDFARQAQQFCSKTGIRFELIRLQGAPANAESVEAWASEQRYRALATRCVDIAGASEIASMAGAVGDNTGAPVADPGQAAIDVRPAPVVLTAHHEDDQAETVLLRLLRGTGERGLTGIQPDIERHGCRFVRPLLGVSRSLIEAYAREHGLDWIEDPSNLSQRFARNALRHRLMPLVEELAPGASHRIAQAAAHVRDSQAVLRGYLDDVLQGMLTVLPGRPRVEIMDLSKLQSLTPARCAALLRRWIERHGIEPASTARLDALQSLVARRATTYGQWVHEGWVWLKYRDNLYAIEQGAEMLERIGHSSFDAALRIDGDGRVLAADCESGQLRISLADGPAVRSPTDALMRQFATLQLSNLRTVSDAEFRRVDQAHARSIKDHCQQLGLPRWLRPAVPMLIDESQQPVWLAGLGWEQRFAMRGGMVPQSVNVNWQWTEPAAGRLPEHRLLDWLLGRSGL